MTTITKQVKQGDSVSIQATPNTGYTFTGWTEGGDSSRIITDNPYTFTPDSNTSIDAVFSELEAPLSWTGSPGSIVLKNSNGQTHTLWSAAGTNKYYGDVEGFSVSDIVSVYINDPDSTSRIPTTTWLTSINMNGLTNLTLQKRSFAYCTGLTSVVLPNSSYSIADTVSGTSGAFQGCTSLSSLSLGGCTSIGSHSFQGCTSLGTVNLPSSCTSIGAHAFESCSSLQTLNFASSGSSLSIGILAFSNCDIRSIEFPSYLTEIVESTYGTCVDIANRPNKNNACNPFQGNTNLTSITKTINTGRYRAEGNCLIDSQYLPNAVSGDTSYYNAVIIGCKNSIIPDTGSSPSRIPGAIGAAAFMNMGITSITIPERIRYIESYAFYNNSNLSSISFSPDTGIIVNPYLRICGNAFGYCTSLSTITFPSRLKQFGNTYANGSSTYYSPDVFYNCSALRTAHLESIATPPSIISGPSFSGENLFPSTIERIYVKPGTMQAYQSDSKWAYWYNQKKLYIGVRISSDVSPAGSSTVSKSSNSVEFQSDSAAPTVILTATPTTGYTFSSWKRGSTVLSTSNPYTATVVDDGTGTDEFTALSTVASYSISASVNPSGGGTVSGTGSYSYGDSCTLTCTPASGYAFSEWTEGGSTVSSSSSYTFTVSGNRTLVAACQSTVPMHTITVLKGQNAELSPEYKNPTFSGGGTYPEGTTITISMTSPSTQYTVAQWYNQTETVQGNYDTWTKYSLNGHYVDSNSISYTVGDHDETIYCNVFSAGGNSIYCRHFETYDDPMMTPSIPAFDCYDSNNDLLGTWTGAMDQGVDCPFTASSVYKLVNHVEYIEPEWDPGNPMPVYSNLVYLDSADFSGLINLHEIDGYGGSDGVSMNIGATSFILPPSCTVVKNMHFGAAQLYDESTQQLMLYYPRQINFGNVETVEGVKFVSYDIENPNTIVQEMTLWDGEGNHGIRQWAVSTYKLSSMTDFSIGQCYQPELYFPNLPSGSSIGAQGLPALTGDTVYMTPNITKISLQDCSGITSITIPAHIEEIGNMRCSNLTSITFEGGLNSHLKYIGQYAFNGCKGLTSINIPYMVAKISGAYMTPNIGQYAFSGCKGLTTATIGARAVDGYIFSGCTSLTSVSLPYLSTITRSDGGLVGQAIFFGCSSLRTVRLGSYYSGYVQGVSRSWLNMATGNISTPFWKYNNNNAPSTITVIYYDYEDGPSSSLFINSGIPNSKFVLHIGQDAIDDGSDWSNIGNLKTDPDRLEEDL